MRIIITASKSILTLLLGIAAAPALAQAPPVLAHVVAESAPLEDARVEAARRIVATLQLAAQEYRLAWVDGALTNMAEYEEARLFVAEARRSAALLGPPLWRDVDAQLARLESRLAARMSPDSLAAAATAMERHLTAQLGVSLDERPAREPSLTNGARLYGASCQSCHGLGGRGDGVAAVGLNPPPADLTDTTVLASTTPLDFYRKITHGVPGTSMQAYGPLLSKEERWDIVAHVFALTDNDARSGRSGQLAVVFGTVRGTLGSAMAMAHGGDAGGAEAKVFDAYMAFEAVEGSLNATDPGIVSDAERAFTALRVAVRGAEPDLAARHGAVLVELARAERALTSGRSSTGMFIASLLLLLREGFEAILVVGAIMAVLLKAGASHRRSTVRWGIAAAIVASLLTAVALEVVFRVTPAQREALEGGIMLVAAATLFYVSYWLVSKIEIQAWTRFVKGHIKSAVESGSGLALAGVAFLAVYREGFETVLFYKALYITGGSGSAAAVTSGIVAGFVLLVGVYFAIEKFGLKLPMRPFFAVTGATLAYMAFVFAGSGIKELQEGRLVSTTLVPGGPRNEFLGIYPTVEGLAVQGFILLAILAALVFTFVIRPALARKDPDDPSPQPPAPRDARPERRTQRRRSAATSDTP